MATGNVYVFNATPNTMTLLLNNHLLTASLSGAQQSSGYAAQSFKTARNPAAGDPGVAQFGGVNTLVVSFPDGTAQTYPVNIDPNAVQITNDLQLYIFFNEVILVFPSGTAGPGDVLIKGQALSKAHAKALLKSVGSA